MNDHRPSRPRDLEPPALHWYPPEPPETLAEWLVRVAGMLVVGAGMLAFWWGVGWLFVREWGR